MENSSNPAGKADEVTKVITSKPGSEATIPLTNITASPQPKNSAPASQPPASSGATNQKENNQSQPGTQATQHIKPSSQPPNQQTQALNQPKTGISQPQQNAQVTPPPGQVLQQPSQAKPGANQPPQGGSQVAPQPNNQTNQPKPAIGQPAAPPKPALSSLFNDNKKTTKRNIVAGVLGASFLAGTLAIMGFTSKEEASGGPITPGPINTHNPNAVLDTNATNNGRILLNTELPISTKHNDEIPFEDAKALAREEMGEDGFFIHGGKIHPTMNEDEWNSKTPEGREDYLKQINATPQPERPLEIEIPEAHGGTAQVVLPILSENLRMSFAHDSNGDVFYIDNQGNSTTLSNFSVDENGSLLRTDPETGEINYVAPSAIFEEINDYGSVHVTSIIPDIINPIDEGIYMLGPVQEWDYVTNEPREGQGWGWDTTGDGSIDRIDHSMSVAWQDPGPDPIVEPIYIGQPMAEIDPVEPTPEPVKTDSELLQSRIAEIAKDAGIEDITKIKIHETDEGWSVKIKGDDGEKVITGISREELHGLTPTPVTGEIPVGEMVDDGIPDESSTIVDGQPINDGEESRNPIGPAVEGGTIVNEDNPQPEHPTIWDSPLWDDDDSHHDQAQNEPMSPDDGLNLQDNNADLTYLDQNYVDPNQ